MKRVLSAHLKPGMVLAEHVCNEAGVVQLHVGTVLSESAAERFVSLGFGSVAVEMPDTDDVVVTHSVPREVISVGRELLRSLHEQARAAGTPEKMNVPYDALLDLVHRIDEGLESANENVVEVSPVLSGDDYYYVNPINVAAVSMFVASKAGLGRRMIEIGLGALLCDIGVAFGGPQEQHPELGLRVLRQDARFSAYSKAIVFQHHERHDGSGFPRALAGEKIEALARIVAVADTYCGLISEGNSMGMRLPTHEAFDYVTSAAGFDFDRTTVLGVMQYVAPFSVGTVVKLSTGERAIVTRVYKGLTTRPTVRVVEGGAVRDLVLAEPENQTILITEVCNE